MGGQQQPVNLNLLALELDRKTWHAVLGFLRVELDHCKQMHASGQLKFPFVAGMANADLFAILETVSYRIFELLHADQGGTG
jgi:hypothetical protein